MITANYILYQFTVEPQDSSTSKQDDGHWMATPPEHADILLVIKST